MRNLLIGKAVKLTALKEEDQFFIEEWFNNTVFLRFFDYMPSIPMTSAKLQALFQEIESSDDRIIFAIRENSGRIIGIAGFDDIVWSNGVATVYIGIGENTFKGKGLGKEAMELLLDFGFNELNFYRIQLNTISYNDIAIKLYESLGFVREGIFRDFVFRDGKRYDLYLYGLLNKEWKKQEDNIS